MKKFGGFIPGPAARSGRRRKYLSFVLSRITTAPGLDVTSAIIAVLPQNFFLGITQSGGKPELPVRW